MGRRIANILRPVTRGGVTVYENIDETLYGPSYLSLGSIIRFPSYALGSVSSYVLRSLADAYDAVRRFYYDYMVVPFARQLNDNPVTASPYLMYQTWRRMLGMNVFYEQMIWSLSGPSVSGVTTIVRALRRPRALL